MPSEGITTEGLLWFQDLSVPDPYYIVPFIILFVNIANIEVLFFFLNNKFRKKIKIIIRSPLKKFLKEILVPTKIRQIIERSTVKSSGLV